MAAISTRQKAEQLIERIHKDQLLAPKTILFGRGKLDQLGELVFPLAWGGQTAVIITGLRSAQKSGLTDRIETLLTRFTVKGIRTAAVHREPTVEMVAKGVELARPAKPKLVISAGGGSVIDFGKAIAAMLTNEGSVEEYLEGVGTRDKLQNPPLPHIAIPTVAGTGAEMTKNAVIQSPEKGYKKSLRDDSLVPTAALVDPLLMLGVAPHTTASGGMDAITQLIESCLTMKRRRETTDLAKEGLRLMRQSLALAYEDAENIAAREQIALASMLSGVCLANAGLAMAHGIAAALGALHEVPHGLACGILLPHTLRYNRSACETQMADALAAFLNQDRATRSTIDEGIEAIEGLNRWLQIPADLKYLGLSAEDIDRIARAAGGTSMSANPIPMTPEKTREFLQTIA
ncbi:MAG: 1,3-propanediol dehydrogenase [Verrucomicrobia bacterium ADurb.Bin345]|nr:MAG: 1,3-propanediol dehydrogenase [Verrucomicrobia bacterium ADurb.Bin345]